MIDNLKEAIVHAREKAKDLKDSAYLDFDSWTDEGKIQATRCLECSKEHELLATWLEQLDKITEIVTRGLKAQDPINLYKANCLNEIAEILEIKVEPEDKPNDSDQMTIDDII